MRGLDASRVDENLQKWGDSFGLLDRPMVQIWELDAAGVRQHALQRLGRDLEHGVGVAAAAPERPGRSADGLGLGESDPLAHDPLRRDVHRVAACVPAPTWGSSVSVWW
jgi:hypothetical protein